MPTLPRGSYWFSSVVLLLMLPSLSAAQDTCSTTFLVNAYTQSKGKIQTVPVVSVQARVGRKPTPVAAIRPSSQPFHWVLVIDASGSMMSSTPSPSTSFYFKSRNKWHSTINLARKIVGNVPVDSDVGLLMFWGTDAISSPATKDKAVVFAALERFEAIGEDNPKPGKTALWDSIERANSMFSQSSNSSMLVVISDGGDNHSRLDRRGLNLKLAQSGVRVFSVVLSEQLETEEERVGASALVELAQSRGGIALTVDSGGLLQRKASEQDQTYSRMASILADFAATSYEVEVNTSPRTKIEDLLLKPDTRHIQLAYPHAILPCSGGK